MHTPINTKKLSVNRFIKYATVNSGREGRICERPKMIGWSLSQAGAQTPLIIVIKVNKLLLENQLVLQHGAVVG